MSSHGSAGDGRRTSGAGSVLKSGSASAALGVALLGVLAVAVFALAWTLLHFGFYERDQIVDTPVYQSYGEKMANGEIPYRDFRPEYPPLALPAFLVPSLVAGEEDYARAFDVLMALCGAAALVLLAVALRALSASPGRTAAALSLAAVAPLLLGSVVLSRFDYWPAALTIGALALYVRGRDRLGAAGLGLAVAAKIYAGVLLPLVLVWTWRRRGRREALLSAALFAGVLVLCFGPFLVLGPSGLVDSIRGQLSRPLQIESLGSALLLAVGADVEMASGHGSQNIAGTPGDVVGILATVVQAGALLAVWIAFARGPMERERLVRYAAAAVVAFVAFGKVLSPQFLIWLVPLVPLVRGRRGIAAGALLAAALVLTQLWFPFRYWDFARTFDETVSWLVLARDLVLVALLLVLTLPLTARARAAPRS
jgi:uncharacterized membrane protein